MEATRPTATVRGRFVLNGKAMEGEIWFVPDVLWFDWKGKRYPVRGARRTLQDGQFEVDLTPPAPGLVITYDVYSRAGHVKIKLPEGLGPWQMADLMPKKGKHKR